MFGELALYAAGALGAAGAWHLGRGRLALSRAKHPSLQGHARLSRRLAGLVPYYRYDQAAVFACDGAPTEVAERREADLEALARSFAATAPRTRAVAARLRARVPDAAFINAHRVPFQFRELVAEQLPFESVIEATDGNRVRDADGNWAYDLTGSYGLNVLGHEAYRGCVERGHARAAELGPALGGYHPVVADNAERIAGLSGQGAVSFHMSGTEAVMQAVRLARYHSGRRRIVRFAGAYHGWWDGVQVGVGSQRRADDVLTLREDHPATLRVLERRRDIAAVLVSPLQALHPNRAAPGDATLVAARPGVAVDRERHASWLQCLREVCTRRGIALIFDEVFSGFRLAAGGAQEYFGVAADLVAYGKSLGGGLPVGVVAGRAALMKRYRDNHPADPCFARGTFNAHPYVMTAMNEFLALLDTPAVRAQYASLDERWDARRERLNDALAAAGLPLAASNLGSVLSLHHTVPSRYNWMLQFHLRARGLALNWTGTGRLIMSDDFTDADFADVITCIVDAGEAMRAAGWWWHPPGASNRRIGRQILGEMFAATLRARHMPSVRRTHPATSAKP